MIEWNIFDRLHNSSTDDEIPTGCTLLERRKRSETKTGTKLATYWSSHVRIGRLLSSHWTPRSSWPANHFQIVRPAHTGARTSYFDGSVHLYRHGQQLPRAHTKKRHMRVRDPMGSVNSVTTVEKIHSKYWSRRPERNRAVNSIWKEQHCSNDRI